MHLLEDLDVSPDEGVLLWISDISQIFYFLFSLITDKEIQHNTYLNPCSEFILNFLDIIYSQRLHFANNCSYLNLNLCLSNYALFSNHDRGYADLSKRTGIFNHLFLYRFLLKYFYKYIKL